MTIEFLTLAVLACWLIPLTQFVFFFTTDPVPGTKHQRRVFDIRTLMPVSKILLGQKIALIAIIVFVIATRLFGEFPGREWIALLLYGVLSYFAWAAFLDLRRDQGPRDAFMRDGKPRE
ncbi:hypothetical protein [Microbacterium sp. zg-YB36]|uniref:hypothetical protein n=1 Tax=Microbacterium sp. zg-YB36 TaxID=2969407 RepID=UPI00214B4247|nr:hypothetical protein [Microbacterium sp. zg-YB36]MDL5351110.1 hypothetical protein [Microbacterium sp. zg-YB36]